MSTQEPWGMDGEARPLHGPVNDPRFIAFAMLSMRTARSTDAEVRPRGTPQEGDAVRADYGKRDGKKPGSPPVQMPWERNGPTGEGYCKFCHFIVGTWRRKLI